ncbi:MAG: ECF transporter S component [Roseburia sp.]|nr:ECF transporter S component [Roseburia sp.]
MTHQTLRKIVTAALLAAMTCIATMIIRIPTPTFGYIHPGDCFVLLSGVILGPVGGAIAAGIGSMFSDLFSGYASWAPATFLIKALTAGIAGFFFHRTKRLSRSHAAHCAAIIIGGILGEAVMVTGYFLYETALAALGTGAVNRASIAAGIASSAAGIPFNIAQGVVGILLSVLLLPVLSKVPDVREWIGLEQKKIRQA